jgi:hypothetical protein
MVKLQVPYPPCFCARYAPSSRYRTPLFFCVKYPVHNCARYRPQICWYRTLVFICHVPRFVPAPGTGPNLLVPYLRIFLCQRPCSVPLWPFLSLAGLRTRNAADDINSYIGTVPYFYKKSLVGTVPAYIPCGSDHTANNSSSLKSVVMHLVSHILVGYPFVGP